MNGGVVNLEQSPALPHQLELHPDHRSDLIKDIRKGIRALALTEVKILG